jgi:DNA-binding NarL/FixJ family response regulator
MAPQHSCQHTPDPVGRLLACKAGRTQSVLRMAAKAPDATVLAVDDQETFRAALRSLIAATPGLTQVGEAASGEEALVLAADLEPDIVVLDVRMPGMDGIETARLVTKENPRSVVVLISIDDSSVPSAAANSGAVALVRKQDFNRAMLADLWSTYGER